MMAKWLSLAVVVASLSCYHLAQRSISQEGGPAPLFAMVYGVATMIMFSTLVATGTGEGLRQMKAYASHWAPWLLMLAVAGIELGVYAMYRAGWNISTASVSTQAISAGILVVLGLVVFGEHLTVLRSVGLLMCVGGAALVATK